MKRQEEGTGGLRGNNDGTDRARTSYYSRLSSCYCSIGISANSTCKTGEKEVCVCMKTELKTVMLKMNEIN